MVVVPWYEWVALRREAEREEAAQRLPGRNLVGGEPGEVAVGRQQVADLVLHEQ